MYFEILCSIVQHTTIFGTLSGATQTQFPEVENLCFSCPKHQIITLFPEWQRLKFVSISLLGGLKVVIKHGDIP